MGNMKKFLNFEHRISLQFFSEEGTLMRILTKLGKNYQENNPIDNHAKKVNGVLRNSKSYHTLTPQIH